MSDDANQSTDAGLDLDNPESWPSDVAGLAGLAGGDPPAETEVPEKAAVAPGADDGRATAAAAPDTKAEGVLARDGKHIIPYEVLKSEREARKELEAQTATLTAEVKRLTDAAAAQGTAVVGEGTEKRATGGDQAQDLPAEVKAKVDQLREDYGDEFADSWLDNWRTKAELAAVQAWMRTVEADRATAASATRETQEQSIQEAIDAVPLLAQWQSDKENPEWYQAANETHQMLMRSHSGYQAMSWAERMAALPGKVQAVYGESPHSAKHRNTSDKTRTAADAMANATVRRPASMSDIPGGEPPAASEAERLENMTPAQLQASINKMAGQGADKLQRFLQSVS